MSNEDEDTLGLDTPIPSKARAKIARIDNDRLFNPVLGIPYILKNHHKLAKQIQANDRKSRAHKYQREHENLGKVLGFYHMWAHGMFPKATFRDCLTLVRKFGDRLARVKLWRRLLLEAEINKLKVKRGLITEDDAQESIREFSVVVNDENTALEAVSATLDEDDYVAPLDFSFMELSLFVGADYNNDDDDADLLSPAVTGTATTSATTSAQEPSITPQPSTITPTPPPMTMTPSPMIMEEEVPSDVEREAMEAEQRQAQQQPQRQSQAQLQDDDDDDDPFSDDDDEILAAAAAASTA